MLIANKNEKKIHANLLFFFKHAVGVHFKCKGITGHGSLLPSNTAGEKIRYIIDQLMDLRKIEREKLVHNPEFTIGDVTSINLTVMNGGIQTNVLPPLLTVGFDIRLALDVDHDEFEKMVCSFHLK